MTKYFLSLFLILITLNLFGADTLFYDNGNIRRVTKKYKSFKEYYLNGEIKQKVKYDKFWRKGNLKAYDSIGNITTKGKYYFMTTKHGCWKTYDNGSLVKKNKYKFGVPKSDLLTSKGKRIKVILTYGKPSFNRELCKQSVDKYHLKYVAVAGCIVSNHLIFKASIHNTLVRAGMIIRHGFKWKEKINKICGIEKVRIYLPEKN